MEPVLRAVREIGAVLAGLAALVFVLGGVVLAARMALVHLPEYDTVGQLPRELLLSIGLGGVVLPALVVTIPYVLARSMAGPRVDPPRFTSPKRSGRRETIKITALGFAGTAALSGPAIAVGLHRADLDSWLLVPVLVIAGAWTFIALHTRERITRDIRTLDQDQRRKRYAEFDQVSKMAVLVAAWAIPGMVMLQAARPLAHAHVCTTAQPSVRGWLIGASSRDLFVGQETKPHGILVIPRSRVLKTIVTTASVSGACTH
jgi:hypothetical protein